MGSLLWAIRHQDLRPARFRLFVPVIMRTPHPGDEHCPCSTDTGLVADALDLRVDEQAETIVVNRLLRILRILRVVLIGDATVL